MAEVLSIHRVEKRDGEAVELSSATVVADFGIEGDWRSRKGRGRQITLIEAEALEHAAKVLGLASVPPGASRRQVVVRGISLNDTVGRRLRIGAVLIHVDDVCDPCRNLEVKIGIGAEQALANRGGVCARVIEGGVLRPGERVQLVEANDALAPRQ
jgi:MOSC domain-containing protein YiiM